jgi:hypothetical protein
MSDFDWVTERANCSLQKVFRSLELGVKADVDKRNALRKTGEPKWNTAPSGERFSVFREGGVGCPTQVIEFAIEGDGIDVYRDSSHLVGGPLTISHNGQCKLKVDKQELDEWQFRQRALQDLFFQA